MITISPNLAEFTPISIIWDSGVSDSAQKVKDATGEIRESLASTYTMGKVLKTLDELAEVGRKHSMDGWGGDGTKAVNQTSYSNAVKFALALPSNLMTPEIYVDPDGIITFEWYEDKRRVYSVSIGNQGELSYAGLFGLNRTCGTEYLTGNVPELVINNVKRVYSGVI
jgi:hypothetical protein